MESVVTVLDKAEDINLITLYEARMALNLATSQNMVSDDQIEMMIKWSSAEIARYCNRVFASERVAETFYPDFSDTRVLFLSRYPVTEIESIDDNGDTVFPEDYMLDTESGRLLLPTGFWVGPITIVYRGGYDLPKQAPPELSQATLLMTREAYYAATRGDATTRMVGHKESRVIYFDPNARGGGGGGGGSGVNSVGSPTRKAVNSLLLRYIRINV